MGSIVDTTKSALGMANNNKNLITLAGHQVHPIGFGLMGLTWRANPPPQSQAFATMNEALIHSITLWNGGEFYGTKTHNSLHLLAEYFSAHPEAKDNVVITIKGGARPDEAIPIPDGSAENTRRSIQHCIDVLGKVGKKLDIWEPARVDPNTPIEITIRAAKEFVDRGDLGGVALSECSAESIRRASKILPIACVEVEFSLWSTEILTNGVAATCADLNIPIVAYSPLGRGFLTGQIRKFEDIPSDDYRRTEPRFQPENFARNLRLVEEVERLAERKGCTPGQVAMAWILAKSGRGGLPVMVPIPGTTMPERLRENVRMVELGDEEVEEIDALVESVEIVGGRYGPEASSYNFGDSPALEE